jgi:hypothetical protein
MPKIRDENIAVYQFRIHKDDLSLLRAKAKAEKLSIAKFINILLARYTKEENLENREAGIETQQHILLARATETMLREIARLIAASSRGPITDEMAVESFRRAASRASVVLHGETPKVAGDKDVL